LLSILSPLFSRNLRLARKIKSLFGFWPRNIRLYEQAFTHSSVAKEIRQGVKDSNERLEYLGDAILGAVIARMLFERYPTRDEGFLTEMRSRLVNRTYLNKLAIKMGIDALIQYDDSHRLYKSISGDTFEALMGAVYLDKGYVFTERLILNRIVKFHVDLEELESMELNFKSRLINLIQKNKQTLTFEAREEQSADRKKLYYVRLYIDGTAVSEGAGYSKKAAEQTAAENAWQILHVQNPS
jgi:ribonuclease-3